MSRWARPDLRPRIPALASLALAAACGGDAGDSGPGGLAAFPAPSAVHQASVARDDFAGSETCRSCHADQYAAWSGSTHGRAGGAPGPGVVIAPFDGRAIRFADAVVVPRVRSGAYEFVVRQDGFPERMFEVVGVIGRGHMRGGGTQGFLTRRDDGTERFLPWDWSRGANAWFCNTGSRANHGWDPITSDMRLADCGDWPPVRPLGTVDRFANCQECHGSQISTEFDAEARAYRTEYTTLQINCESCHGPARPHVEAAREGRTADLAMSGLAYRDKDASLATCFQCHALKDVVREGYLPGNDLERYYALKFPVLGDQPYFADGRVRSFAYQATHLASACYLQGPMDCVSCHEPHGQGYQDTEKRPLSGPYDDAQCTSCHASKAVEPEAHTFHPPESDGARCVSCHMPYLQHPEVGNGVPFARSDHTIAVPRPIFDGDLGLVGACASCHQDRSALELEGQVRERWGELKPQRPLIEGQVGELTARNAEEAAALLLRPEEVDPLIQFQAMSRLLVAYISADAPLPGVARDRLEALADNPDLDVRALALASLHWSRGNDPEVRRLLVDALDRAEDDEALRGRWVLALGFLGDHFRERGQVAPSEAAYRKALQIRPDDPRLLQNLGLLYNAAGNPAEAAELFQRSLTLDPDRSLTWVNLGTARSAVGDPAGARAAYEEALKRNPHEALAWFNLGNLHQRAGRHAEAADAYASAVAADPGLGQGWFELGRTLIRLERYPEALPAARRAAEFLPDDPLSRQMLADLQRVVEGG